VSLLKKVKLYFAKDLEVEFTDRVRGIQQVYELGEKGTWCNFHEVTLHTTCRSLGSNPISCKTLTSISSKALTSTTPLLWSLSM